jgi:hypothetical protein
MTIKMGVFSLKNTSCSKRFLGVGKQTDKTTKIKHASFNFFLGFFLQTEPFSTRFSNRSGKWPA